MISELEHTRDKYQQYKQSLKESEKWILDVSIQQMSKNAIENNNWKQIQQNLDSHLVSRVFIMQF